MADKKDDAADKDAVTTDADAVEGVPTPGQAETAGPEALGPGAESEPVAVTEAPEATGMDAAGPSAASEPEPVPETAEAARAEHEDFHEDEAGTSLAARMLGFLVILLAGAGIGIWAAPKLAPRLPSGMAPVADWLTPGGDAAETRIAALETEVEAEIAGLSSRVGDLAASDDLATRIDAAVTAAEGRTGTQIEELRTALADLGGDDTSQRLARLESTLEGQVAQLGTLKEQISGGVAATDGLSDEAVEQIDVYRAELDGLRAELGTLSDSVAGLRNRVDEVAATADRSIETAQARVAELEAETTTALGQAAVEANLAAIQAALAAGQPYGDAADELAADDSVTLPDGLAAAAASGAPTLVDLRARFPDAAHAAIRASIFAGAGDGVVARSRAFLEAQVASRSLTPQEGPGTDAVLSRMEESLDAGDLADVLTEADALPSEAAAAMQDWLADARLRTEADAGLAELHSTLPAMN